MQGQLTVLRIKPEAIKHIRLIRGRIQQSNLQILIELSFRWDSLRKTEECLRELHYRLASPVFEQMVLHFYRHTTPVLLVIGENAVQELRSIVGTEADPKKCYPDTLRYQCGEHTPLELQNGVRYWQNGISCSKNAEEALWQGPVFFPFLRPKKIA